MARAEDTTNEVTLAEDGEGRLLVTKRYREARAYRQELQALRDWAPRLPFAAPRVLEDRGEEARELVLLGVPGAVPAGARLADESLYRSAGAALAALHALAFEDRDGTPCGEALEQRLESLVARAEGLLDAGLRRRAEACLEGLRELDWPGPRVPCHRDYEPRNWIVGPRGFGLIDFEQARPDLAEADLVRLDLGLRRDRPELAAAFLAGYGLRRDEELARRLDLLGFIEALGTLVWGLRRDDARFVQRGRSRLELLSGPDAGC